MTAGSGIRLQGLDHIAIAVSDLERSARWYREVLGLEHRFPGAWDGVPVFLGKGDTNLALFPRTGDDEGAAASPDDPPRWYLHFAFRVDAEGFVEAQHALDARGIPWERSDHGLAWSIYFRDPDGYQLEITTYDVAG